MKKIKTLWDLYLLRDKNILTHAQNIYLIKSFVELYQALDCQNDIRDFSLEDHGYFVILEKEDDTFLRSILVEGFEYIETEILEDKSQIFKIAVMQDNDHMMFYFSEVGQFSDIIEKELEEHCDEI